MMAGAGDESRKDGIEMRLDTDLRCDMAEGQNVLRAVSINCFSGEKHCVPRA